MSTAVANNPQPLYLRRRIVNIVALLLVPLLPATGWLAVDTAPLHASAPAAQHATVAVKPAAPR